MASGRASEGNLSLGVFASSRKENELRLPLHPRHLPRISAELQQRVFLEEGYGERFGIADEELRAHVAGFRTRDQLVAECDVILNPKPVLDDIEQLRRGQVFWGWPHCVQDAELTQVAIDKGLTVIAFEAMNHWNRDGSFNLHVFHSNNELAGYASVVHAMQLTGTTGHYGPQLRGVVIGFGATARGAVLALNSLGVSDVDVLTHREVSAVASPIHGAGLLHFDRDQGTGRATHVTTPEGLVPTGSFLAGHDVVVNCVLQDTDAPEMFMTADDLSAMKRGSLVVDVSCDEGMGFSWARPTSFDAPVFVVGDNVTYYAVDHSPSHLWKSSTWVNSEALLPFVGSVLEGGDAWDAHPTIRRAIEIREGVIQNQAILTFQGRSPQHPHYPLAT
ncbi:N(5)-(carboxyethyl)ornithine synthase [Nocardioides pacificus]